MCFVHVCHIKLDKKSDSVFGHPFWLEVDPMETVAEVKIRIQAKLQVYDEEFAKWCFLFHPQELQPVRYLQDTDVVLDKFLRVPPVMQQFANAKYYGDQGMFLALGH